MVRIMSDTSTLFSVEEGAAIGVRISPLSVTLDGHSYVEYEEISSAGFLELVRESQDFPRSSQPSIGSVLAAYEEMRGEETINITMADGLSGTYESACAAREQAEDPDDITVYNSRTLCGPHRYMVKRANEMAKSGATREEILQALDTALEKTRSFLTVADFDFLQRGGRLSPLAAKMMSKLKAIPVVMLSEDGSKLDPHMLHRSKKVLIRDFIVSLRRFGLEEAAGKDWLLSISHAGNPELAESVTDALSEAFPSADVEMLELSPAFITQGGPGCVAVQTIHEW